MGAGSQSLVLLPIGEEHLALLSEIHRAVFGSDGWSAEDWRALTAVPGAFGWLALQSEGEERPIAFLLGRHAGGEAEILTLGTLPQARRLGAAQRLVEAFLSKLAAEGVLVAYLEVAETNSAAISLYRRLRFYEVGRREGYYKRKEGREDALILRWRDPMENPPG